MVRLSYDEAIERTLALVAPLPSETVALHEAAGRTLAEDVTAAVDLPRFDHSAMDGYAIACDSLPSGDWVLPVVGESRAGEPLASFTPGSACRIFTGAVIPDGADTVVIQENVVANDGHIHSSHRPTHGEHVRRRGTDLAAGATPLRAGERLDPGKLGLAASLDRASLLVSRRPTLAICSTGDELRAPGTSGPPSSIPESNGYVLSAIARHQAALPAIMPLVADDPTTTRQALRKAASSHDLVVTVGGASVGDHDLVRPALEAMGAEVAFWGVNIKPGKPVGVAMLPVDGRRTLVLCLPGNPASATLTFLLFGVPMLRALQGRQRPLPQRPRLAVIGERRRRPGRDEYLRATLELREGELCAVLPNNHSSGAVTSFAQAEALAVLPAAQASHLSGQRLEVILQSQMWG